MIALKPYRETQASPNKGDKKRLAGRIRTGESAYAWYRYSPLTSTLGNYLGIGSLITVILAAATSSLLWFVVFGAVCLVGLLIINPLWQQYLKRYIGEPSMLVSSAHVRRGDTFEIEFCQPFERSCVVTSITIHLIRREWVRYKCGTDTCTATRDKTIQRIHNRNKEQVAGGSYKRRAEFRIPPDAMHSFALPDNHLIWLIRVNLKVRNFTPLTETYAIHVTPEVHTYD